MIATGRRPRRQGTGTATLDGTDSRETTPHAEPESGVRRRPGAAALVFAGYTALALILFSAAWLGPEGSIPGNGGDAGLFVWDLQWVPHALTHGMNPLVTDYILFPHGANLMWNTSIVAPAVVVWPVTAAFGPIVAYRVMMTAALALSSWCAYLALRRFAGVAGASTGGLLYGFSPYMMIHALGHANLVIAVFPPLLLLMLDDVLVRQRRSPRRSGALLGLLCAVQLLTGEELLLVTVAVAVLGASCVALLHRRLVVARLPHIARAVTAAAGVFAPLAALPLWVQFGGPNRVRGLLRPLDQFSNDLVDPVNPTWLQHGPMLGAHRVINGESAAYLGIPLIALLGYACWRWRRRPEVRVAAVVGVIALVMSFGGVLHYRYAPTRFHGPFALFDHLPLLQNLEPARFMLFTYLMAAVVVAIFVDQLVRGRRWWRRGATYAMLLALLPLVPERPYPHAAMPAPAYFAGDAVKQLPEGGPVLVTPYYDYEAMTWQGASGFRFRLVNGSAYRPGPVYGPGLTRLGGALSTIDGDPSVRLSQADVAAAAAELRQQPWLRAIVVGPGPGHDREVALFTSMMLRAPDVYGDVTVWRDPHF